MIASQQTIRAFDPGDAKPARYAFQGLSNEEAARALAQGHPKSAAVELHKGTDEGPRTGLPHMTPVSTRYVTAHAAVGTKVTKPGDGP
jgi:hypothetical protein